MKLNNINSKLVSSVAAAYQSISHIKKPLATSKLDTSQNVRSEEPASAYRASTPPSGLPLSKILSNTFPLPVAVSFQHYLQRRQLDQIQDDLLHALPFYPNPTQQHTAQVVKTKVDSSGNYINEFYIAPTNPSPNDKHVVFVHGYGAGLGFFIKNLQAIAQARPNWHIHAIDLVGYGCSSRPKFPHHIPFSDYEKVESLFTESLKNWFDSRGLSRNNTMVVAHSMGAYLSSLTNFKYPDLFGKLLLVSPAGIYSSQVPSIPAWFGKLWNRNVSPFSLVRNSGPFGSYFVSGWTSRRFSKNNSVLNAHEQELMHMYTYAIFNARGSGEYMLNYMLAPGGVPRNPLLHRIQNLNCDSVWYYGSHDWMDKSGGLQACQKLRAKGLNAKMLEVKDSGHHIYLDNFDTFNELTVGEMDTFNASRS